jgi:hypothetical protein
MAVHNPIVHGAVRSQLAIRRGLWGRRDWPFLLLVVVLGAPILVAESLHAVAAAAAPSTEGLGTGDGEQTGTKVVITELKRGGTTLTLKFTIYNDSATDLNVGGRFNAPDYKDNGGRSFSGVHLIDGVAKKKYFVVADSDGNCLCSEHVDDVKAKTQVSLWAKFPAPPDSVQKITVQIPRFIPVDDVPIR